ncbi:hypothetical protein EDD11_008564 [Mortierella claussenii]|nr:hypothetical protein EDD11_008564 [Mortierella claussenii]
MKVNRRHFIGILYDCVLFEYASQLMPDKNHTLSLDDLADTFAFVADFYKHHRPLMDIPCDQFITRNQLHTVAGLVDYIEEMDRGVFEIFPGQVELREETPSFASTSSMKRERRRQERLGSTGTIVDSSNSSSNDHSHLTSKTSHDSFGQPGRGGWAATMDLFNHRGHDLLHPDTDTDLDDEYSIIIPGLTKTDIQTFLWEYAYMPEEYQDDIATLIRYLRKDEWMMNGSKGSIITFDWGLEGVQKFSKEYNQTKIRKVELREQEEVKKFQEAIMKQQEEWNRQQELIREQEAAQRIKVTDDFIWKMYKSLVTSPAASVEIDNLIKNLEMEISEYFGFCFVALTAVGDLDLTLTGNIKHITIDSLANALRSFEYEGVAVTNANTITISHRTTSSLTSISSPSNTPSIPPSSVSPTFITFTDPKSGTTCHLTLNEPLAIYRSKLIRTYSLIEPRFSPVIIALKHLAAQRHLLSGSVHQEKHSFMPLGSYTLALMLITFLQTENPPLLPKLQQQTPLSEDHEGNYSNRGHEERPSIKETIVQGIDCSFDRDWEYYRNVGNKNTKSVAELLMEFCRFFGYVFDYESKEVNARIGAFRWRPGLSKTLLAITISGTSSSLSNSVVSAPSASLPSVAISSSSTAAVFHVMDPFVVGLNVTSACGRDVVRLVKECFQEAYEALMEGDINLAFSKS